MDAAAFGTIFVIRLELCSTAFSMFVTSANVIRLELGSTGSSSESPPSQFSASIARRDDGGHLFSPSHFNGKGLLVAQITGFTAELKYSDCGIWILGVFILTLFCASSEDTFDNRLGIEGIPGTSWINN